MPRLMIIFDLDGTLVDTAPDLVDALNVVFGREGLAPLPYEVARNLIGGGVKAMITNAMETKGRMLSQSRLEQMLIDFLAYYSDHIADRSRPFPGLVEALDVLEARGHQFAVCTNKLEHLSVRLLDHFKLTARFGAICGQDSFRIQKPDPEILRRTVLTAGGTMQHAIMVGDSITDICTARAAGVPIVAVDFGYSDRPIAEFGPDQTISDFAQLPASIAAISSVLDRYGSNR